MALISVILIVALVTVSSITYFYIKDLIDTNARNEAGSVVHELTRSVNQVLEGYSTQLVMFSTDDWFINYLRSVDNGDEDTASVLRTTISQRFRSYLELDPSVKHSYIGGERKTMDITPTVNLGTGFDPTTRPWYLLAKADPESVIWTDPYISEDNGELVVTAAKAILEPRTNAFLGVVGLDISLEGMSTTLNEIEISNGGFAALFANDGTALVHPTQAGVNLSENETIQQMLSGEDRGYIIYRFEGLERFMYYSTIPETGWKINTVYIYKNLLTALDQLRNLILLVSAAMIIVSLLVGWRVSMGISRPIIELKTHVSKVASGDLSVKAETKSRDEVGEFTNDFNQMVEQMKHVIESVQNSATKVNHSAQNLNALSEESIASSEEISSAMAEVASGSARQADDVEVTSRRTVSLSAQIEKVTTETTEMDKLAKETKQISKNGTNEVRKLQDKSEEVNKVLLTVEEVMNGLSDKIAEIEHVMATINGISEQTNLLALNASIEAARAGEHGKGFAVVASEVRKLAEQSSHATVGVSNTINGIVAQSEKVISEITRTKEIFSSQKEAIFDTNESFSKIVNSIEEIATSLAMVQAGMNTMTEHKDNVVDSIQNIAAVAEETAASVEEVSAASDQQVDALTQVAEAAEVLNHSSNELLDLVKRFKIE